MSFRCILDVALFLDRFRNIDLYQQGLYCLKFSLTYRSPRSRISALVRDRRKADFIELPSMHTLMPPSVLDGGETFTSGVFLIRYTEEEAILRELATFRFELDIEDADLDGETILTCGLMYSDLDSDLEPSSLLRKVKSSTMPVTFTQQATSSYRLRLSAGGFQEFIPITFDESHKSLVTACVHCAAVDYLLRSDQFRTEQESFSKRLANVLFVDRKRQPKMYIGGEEIDSTYSMYVGRLALAHEFLRSALARLATPDLTMEESAVPERLSLPILHAVDDTSVARFSEAVWSHDPVEVATALIEEVAAISTQIVTMFSTLNQVLQMFPGQVLEPLSERYVDRLRVRDNFYISRTARRVREMPIVPPKNIESDLQSTVALTRSQNPMFSPLPVESTEPQVNPPLLFEETYVHIFPEEMTAAPSPRSVDEGTESTLFQFPSSGFIVRGAEGKDLFILVHGFQGRPYDVHLLKQVISLSNPNALVHAAVSNEKQTDGDLRSMGERLATEVKSYIAEWCPGAKLRRLSFIGHSMGGLIIRTAVPHLVEYADKMHLLMTLSTPHLGYMYNSSKLIDAGIWVLKKWKRSLALQQLSMTDDSDMESTVLCSLSTSAGMRWFQHVILCSSYQDHYVPHDSARVEVSANGPLDPTRARIYQQMAFNILSQVSLERLIRLDVNFKLKNKGLDSMIGRTAHIQFLENERFLEMVVRMYPNIFS